MKTHPDIIENRPAWLSETIVRVLRLPEELPPKAGVEGHTLRLLKSIEADSLPVPGVCVTNRGSIRLVFESGDCELHVFVTGESTFSAVRVLAGRRFPRTDVRRGRVERLRELVAWLCPGANGSPVQMVAGWEVSG